LNTVFQQPARGAGTNLPLRRLIVNEMKNRIGTFGSFDSIAGIAKSGTVWGAWLAWDLNLPFMNVLLEGPRSSGLNREVEGDAQGKRVILVDNWIRTGESIDKAIKTIHNAGAVVTAILVVTRRPEISFQMPTFSVWELTELVKASKELGLIPKDLQFNGY